MVFFRGGEISISALDKHFFMAVAYIQTCTAVSSEAWTKLREWAILASKGQLLLSGNVVLASLKAAVHGYVCTGS